MFLILYIIFILNVFLYKNILDKFFPLLYSMYILNLPTAFLTFRSAVAFSYSVPAVFFIFFPKIFGIFLCPL